MNRLRLSRFMTFHKLNINVFTIDGAGAVASVISDMFPGPNFNIILGLCTPQPVYGGIHQRLDFPRLVLYIARRFLEHILIDRLIISSQRFTGLISPLCISK